MTARALSTLAVLVAVLAFAIAGTAAAQVTPNAPTAAQPPPQQPPLKPGVDRLARAIEIIQRRYVAEPDNAKLVNDAIRGMLTRLDPDAHYFTAEELRNLRTLPQAPGALGLHVRKEPPTRSTLGGLRVITADDGSPAAIIGLRPSDIITHIDDAAVTPQLSVVEASQLLAGPVNTPIRLTVQRRGQTEPLGLLLMHAARSGTLDVRVAPGGVVIARLSSFADGMAKRFVDAVTRARTTAGGAFTGVVLDLRDAAGGVIDQAVAVADAFLDDGLIATVRVRASERTETLAATPGDVARGYPIVVLVNGGTAGVAEVIAGALKDRKRATLVGTRTFGRASKQSLRPIGLRGSSGAILLTTLRYETPDGKRIDGNGVTPDVALKAPDLSLPCRDGDAVEPDHDGLCLRRSPSGDPQIVRAIEVLQAKRAEAAAPAQKVQ